MDGYDIYLQNSLRSCKRDSESSRITAKSITGNARIQYGE